jgi:hypothetical protein
MAYHDSHEHNIFSVFFNDNKLHIEELLLWMRLRHAAAAASVLQMELP